MPRPFSANFAQGLGVSPSLNCLLGDMKKGASAIFGKLHRGLGESPSVDCLLGDLSKGASVIFGKFDSGG